jgi:hypothetical protein
MTEYSRGSEPDPPHTPAPGERIERTEIVESSSSGAASRPRGSAPMWAWVLPLVLVAIVLVWYILTRGQPESPLDRVTPDVFESNDAIEAPAIREPSETPADAPASAPTAAIGDAVPSGDSTP